MRDQHFKRDITEEEWKKDWTVAKIIFSFSTMVNPPPMQPAHKYAIDFVDRHADVLKEPRYTLAQEYNKIYVLVKPYNIESFKILYKDTVVSTYRDGVLT